MASRSTVSMDTGMARTVLLDNVAHRALRVITGYSARFGDSVNQVMTFPTEYGDIQREYPILFRKDPGTGEFQSIALLGLDRGENLFLDEPHWRASYVPSVLARGPFLIGFQQQELNGELHREPVIHVDLDHPRVSETEGEPVFLPHGGHSPYLERVSAILRAIYDGVAVSQRMFAAFDALGLIEPVNVEIKLSDAEQYNLSGYYTVGRDKLAELDGESLERLNRQGFLQGAFLVLASLANVTRLIDIKNRRRASG